MKKIVFSHGLIAGFISCIGFVAMNFTDKINFDNGMYFGYASMIIGFSLIFVAVKNYRDNQVNGAISFGRAFRIGLYISLVAATVYVAVWLVNYYFFIPDFMDQYAAHYISKMEASGASQAAIQAATAEMEGYKEFYKNPLLNILITYTEILPVGLLLSLISAAILNRKPQHINL